MQTPAPVLGFPGAPARTLPAHHGTRSARTVALVGACGAAGTSTLAAVLAHGSQRAGAATVLVDRDDGGGGTDVLLGIEDEPGARWPGLGEVRGEIDGRDVVAALPFWRGVPVLSVDRHAPAPVDPAVVADVLRSLGAVRDLLVLDVPRASLLTPDVAARCDVVLVVVPTDLRGVSGALGAVAALRTAPGPALALVARRTARGGCPPDEIEDVVGLPVVADVRWDRAAGPALDRGDGPPVGRRTVLGRAARTLADAALTLPAPRTARVLA